jgi:hypothetical protein
MALTDARLAQLGKMYKDLQKQEETIKIRKERIKDKVIAELDRRNTRLIETGGWKITKVQQEEVRYSFEALTEALGSVRANKLRPDAVDKSKLAALLASNRADPALIAQCSQVIPKSPYISVVPAG